MTDQFIERSDKPGAYRLSDENLQDHLAAVIMRDLATGEDAS